jgi:hypothetical protein
MAALLDAATELTASTSQNPSLSHGGGTPTGAGILVAYRHTNSPTINSVTYGGQACAFEDSQDSGSGNEVVALYSLASPPSGTQTVQVNYSAAPDRDSTIFVVTVTGGSTSDVFSAVAKANMAGVATGTVDVASDTDELVMGGTNANNNITAVGAGQTKRLEQSLNGAEAWGSTEAGASPTVTHSYTASGDGFWAVIAGSFAAGGAVQLLAPASDISAGTWLPSAGSPAELWQMIDGEKSPDSDYDYTTSAGTMEVKFAPGSTPTLQTGHTLRYRLRGNGTCDALVKLKVGSTVLAQWTETNVPAVDTDYSHTLDSSPSFTISDYTDLRISVEAVP